MPSFRATYSPEDNKLRLYASERLDAEDYALVKKHGFKWAPKQELFVAPAWSPAREDCLLEFVDEIEDEDYSPGERAADRAERFSGYRDKRRAEAGASADRFEAGPRAFGNQSRTRAERQAARHDRLRTGAVSCWSKAEYWHERTAGVLGHALYLADPRVRRGRILRIEADLRKRRAERAEMIKRYETWKHIAEESSADLATRAALVVSGNSSGWREYNHPRKSGVSSSIYSLMTRADDPITGHEAAALVLAAYGSAPAPEDRWTCHYELRLTYERAMLAAEGGSAGDVEMIVGGFFGGYQIHKINRSPATKAVVSVAVMGRSRWDRNPDSPLKLVTINVQKSGEAAYRAPTPEELESFLAEQKASKAAAKAERKTVSLINPTDEDAERLQHYWNEIERIRHENQYGPNCTYSKPVVGQVQWITQAVYSANSGGSSSRLETITVCEHGRERRHGEWRNTSDGCKRDRDESPDACKLRTRKSGGFYSPAQVIILTDKPQKPIPLDWDSLVLPEAKRETVDA